MDKTYEIEYKSTAAERYDTDLNERVEQLLGQRRGITIVGAEGGSDGITADNIVIVRSTLSAERLRGEVFDVIGERPFTVREV